MGVRASGCYLEGRGKIATEDGRRSYLDRRRRVHKGGGLSPGGTLSWGKSLAGLDKSR